jgi:diguanylate cyclase (GGDEF)-like protein
MVHIGGRAIARYVTVVVGGGAVVALALARTTDWSVLADPLVLLFVALVLLAELFPITVPWRDEAQTVSTSTTWSFALLLVAGPGVAAAAQAIASVSQDVFDRKPWWKTAFNAAQYVIAIAAAGAVLSATGVELTSSADVSLYNLSIVMVAGLVFYITNNLLVGSAIALAQGLPVGAYVRSDFWFQSASNLVLISQAPLVVIAANVEIWLVPLFVPVVAAAWHTARLSVDRERLAFRDQLTDLPNRLAFERELDMRLRGGTEPIVALLLDIDGFRDVNDTLGHRVGDRILTDLAHRLEALDRPVRFIARLGADEFGVLCDFEHERAVGDVVERIASADEEPVLVGGERVEVVASIGGAIGPEHGATAELLLQRADVALRSAKERRAGWLLYQPSLDHFDPQRLTLLTELRHAIRAGELVPYFQPKAELSTGRVVGFEALVRWEHPSRGTLLPADFLGLAETTGLMDELTTLVLDGSLAAARMWRAQGFDVRVAVNFSAQSLQDQGLPANVGRTLAKYDLPGSALAVEVTETAAMDEPEKAVRVLAAIHGLGVTVALDDYGTGHASLAWIKRLPIDELKIDGSFVASMLVDDNDASIVTSTVEMAKRLGLTVTAEGVESQAVWNRLLEIGCDQGQGYLLSRPMPARDVSPWLAAHGAVRRREQPRWNVRELLR